MKKAPFLKILPAFIAGILATWYLRLDPWINWLLLTSGCLLLLGFFFLPTFSRFRYPVISFIAAAIIFIAAGALIAINKDPRRWNKNDHFNNAEGWIVTLNESPVKKPASFKAEASFNYCIRSDSIFRQDGKIILYFSKENGNAETLHCGSRLLFRVNPREINYTANPGGFDYKRYALFKGITHQVFLRGDDYYQLPFQNRWSIKPLIENCRQHIVSILRKNIPGEKEKGMAEALLIGYKQDLDPSLVRSYANTGVAHVIAISGLHMGLIYWLLNLAIKPLGNHGKYNGLRTVLIIGGLWSFGLLAGASPSVLRSALMFSFIVIGESMQRNSSVLNSLAASAFLLLAHDPWLLWDAGFQLSYTAVLSIVLFMRPIYNLLYFPGRLPDLIWKMNAVTLAAQLLTTPLTLFHFHQFPVYFIISNFLAVPLSSLLVLTEIALCCFSFIPFLAAGTGKLVGLLIVSMNFCVEKIETFPGATWMGLQFSVFQVLLLFFCITGLAAWLMNRWKGGLLLSVSAFFVIILLRTNSFIESDKQTRIVIYNLPRQTILDFIEGRKYKSVTRSPVTIENNIVASTLFTTRSFYRVTETREMKSLVRQEHYIQFHNTRILLLDEKSRNWRENAKEKTVIDLLLLSGNCRVSMDELNKRFKIRQAVVDPSVPSWKSKQIQVLFYACNIPIHDIKENGAFVMNLR